MNSRAYNRQVPCIYRYNSWSGQLQKHSHLLTRQQTPYNYITTAVRVQENLKYVDIFHF
jgi:hypothetical protein